jgi:MtN3 and saliva related transmembrane protein
MDFTGLIGFIAGFFSMISFVPQVYKTLKTKSAAGVSGQMFIIVCISNMFWITYGFALGQMPIIVTNVVMLSFALTQLILKIKYDKKQNK